MRIPTIDVAGRADPHAPAWLTRSMPGGAPRCRADSNELGGAVGDAMNYASYVAQAAADSGVGEAC